MTTLQIRAKLSLVLAEMVEKEEDIFDIEDEAYPPSRIASIYFGHKSFKDYEILIKIKDLINKGQALRS